MKARSPKSAFTLIELLTVIAIIGILAAILIPTVGAVRKRALKSQCASNLHQLGMALNLYVNDNRQFLPDGTVDNTNLQWISTRHRDALKSYGMTAEMFFCNSNPAYRDADLDGRTRLEWARTRDTRGNGIPIGYIYLPGTVYPAITQSGSTIASKYKETRYSRITYRLIAADLNRKWNNDFSGGVNHSDSAAPFGGNHLYIDGSVKWVSADKFLARAAMSGGGSDYYFMSED